MQAGTAEAKIRDVSLWRETTLHRNDKTPWQARQATGLWLTDSHPGTRSDALQIVAELVANVLQHVPSGQHRDWIVVRIGFGKSFIRLEVIDPGTRAAEPCFTSRPQPTAESGRGLGIVAALSVRCGTETIEHGHRVVWADLAVAAR